MNQLDIIKEELNIFIEKFYKNQFLKGFLLFSFIFLSSLYIVSLAEFYGRFNSIVRFFFLSIFLFFNLYIAFVYCVTPLLNYIKQSRRLSPEKASKMIGLLFPEISDQLTNLLQLDRKLSLQEKEQVELLKASIEQKAKNIGVVKFSKGISYAENKKYLKFVLPAVFLFFIFLNFLPEIFTQGSFRVLNFSKEFKLQAPYQFYLVDPELTLSEGEDLYLKVNLVGKDFPDRLYINSSQGVFIMNKLSANTFEYVLRKPKNKESFFLSSKKFKSDSYKVNVHGKSILGKWDALIKYPSYLNRTNELIKNSGDFSVPEGSLIEWNGRVKNVSEIQLSLNSQVKRFYKPGFIYSILLDESGILKIKLKNKYTDQVDSLNYVIKVIKDEYPVIQVMEDKDSLQEGICFFEGVVSDDYGLTSLNFHYTVRSNKNKVRKEKINVQNVNGTRNSFVYYFDFNQLDISLNDEISYYFSIQDNDGYNGNKTTLSSQFTYDLPDLKSLNKKRENEQKDIKKEINDVLRATQKFQEEIKSLKKEIKNNKSNEWNKLNDLKNLKDQQQELLNKLEHIQKKMEQSTQEKNKLSELDKELLKKQDLLEELLNEVMDDELKKLLEELEELLKKNDQKELNEKMDALDQEADEMEKQLDRSLEMLKKMQVNEKIDDLEKELQALAQKQEKLSGKQEKRIEDQEEINKDFYEIKEELKKLEELNKALENPLNIENTQEEQKSIEEELQQAGDQIQKNKKTKASKSQKKASKKMEELAEKLDKMQQDSAQGQQEEDMEDLRKILESLILLSIEQEAVMDNINRVQVDDPAFRKYGRVQRRINDDTQVVKDSLLALAKRQPVLATFIDKELADLEFSHGQTIDFIGDRKKGKVAQNQQIAMTSYNNLALLLNEVLQSMQAQMQMMTPGSGQCNKPGGKGKPKAGPSMNSGDMKEMLKNQLEQLKKGANQGGKKEGKSGENGTGGIGSKGLAKIAAEQSAIRKKLEELRNKLNKEGKGAGNALNPLIEELKEQQKNIINKNINKETINRQQQILTRLLESEKALIERGFEEKRESKSGKNTEKSNQNLFNEYNKEKLKKIELLRYAEPSYKRYYKERANEYFDEN
tara:strand:+ start:17375 stop:20689 length:3315 start_codon:yes stop_codon:yes gene_type:complete